MQNLHVLISHYCEAHTSPPDPVLAELERETHLKTLSPQMLSAGAQGKLLEFLCYIFQPKSVLEIGTFTGYAAICMARGLAPGGILHTIEVNPELEWLAKKYFEKAGLLEKIKLYIEDASQRIPQFSNNFFDLIFIDAGKQQNDLYYEMCLPKLRKGGLILVDNVLWSGKVVQKTNDPDTALIRAFNDKIQADPRVENLMLPIRDGLFLIRKI